MIVRRSTGIDSLLLLVLSLPLCHVYAEADPVQPKPPQAEKPKGPEHNVTLNEEEEVVRLLAKAKAARLNAEQDKEGKSWPECIKAYADILLKHSNTVYLARWAGDNGPEAKNFGLGVYRSTGERVAEELASLPTAGLAIYRAVNDGAAQRLSIESREKLDEATMERVAQTYFSTTWGDDALHWLGEMAYDRRAERQALLNLEAIEKHPDPSVSKCAVLARTVLAEVKAGMRKEAEKTLAALTEALKDPKNGELRVGHATGETALASLRARLEATPKTDAPAVAGTEELSWPTYFGNAAHNKPLPSKNTIGVRKWSESIARLLGASENAKDPGVKPLREGNSAAVAAPLQNFHLVTQGSWFFLCNSQVMACHPINNPNQVKPQFLHPSPAPQPRRGAAGQEGGTGTAILHPYFCTLGGDRLFVTLGPEPFLNMPNWGWGGNAPKQSPNWMVALGKKRGGTLGVESGCLIWTLESGNDLANTKADQEWLKTVRLVSSPTYVSGTLYVMAVSEAGGTRESWVTSFDAETGRLLWKTMICSANPVYYGGAFQADLGLPVAVAGGTVFAVTNLGAVAALESASGRVRWIRIYERAAGGGNNPNGMQVAASRDLWAPNPPMVIGDALIVTPQDSDFLFALDPLTGKRKWQTERVSDAGPGGVDSERLRHVLGVSHEKWLVVSGKNVWFIALDGGRREYRALISDESAGEIVGRGLVTPEAVWIPTAKKLVRVDARLSSKGKPIAKIHSETPWADEKTDPGNLFIVGEVLFSVSSTHVSAYFDWEVLKQKLVERIKTQPADLSAYQELGDGEHISGHYESAISFFEQGLAAAGKRKETPGAQASADDLRSRKFESFFAWGEDLFAKNQLPEAFTRYESGFAVALAPDQFVRALWKMAEVRRAQKDLAGAVGLYHRMLVDHGDVVFGFELRSKSRSSVFAQKCIGEIKSKNPEACEKLEALAKEALRKAQASKQAKALEAFLAQFPNSDAYGEGLLSLAGLSLETNQAEVARQNYQRFLSVFRDSPRTAEVQALLALSFEKTGMLGSAKSCLLKLVRTPALAEVEIAPLGQAKQKANAWATERLALPQFQKPSTTVPFRMGSGKLAEAWSKPVVGSAYPLFPAGNIPAEMLRSVLFIEGGTDLTVRSGARGEELWLPRPKLPAGFQPGQPENVMWIEEQLVVAGRNEVVAYDSRQKGKEIWRYVLNQNKDTGGGNLLSMQSGDRRVILAQEAGQLTVLDVVTGKETWRTQVEGAQIFIKPAVGEGFVAAATAAAPQRIILYEMDTGKSRLEIKVPGDRLAVAPVAVGEFVFMAGADNNLRAFDAVDGKALWDAALDAPAVWLEASHEMIVVVQNTLTLSVFDPQAAEPTRRLKWKAKPEGGGTFLGVVADGEDVFLAVQQNRGGKIFAYQARGGKFKWPVDMAAGDRLTRSDLAQEHLLILQAANDPQGQQASSAALVHRTSGKLVWAQNFSTSRVMGIALYDGGVAVVDGRRIAGFTASDAQRSEKEVEALEQELAKNPQDPALRTKLAQAYFERGDGVKAFNALQQVLEDPKTDPETFVTAYDRYARYRREWSKKNKPVLTFQRINQAPKIDGDLSDWGHVQSTALNTWKNIYLGGEDDARQAVRREVWKGPQDLAATFYGAYDDRKLYLAVKVADDVHKNAQTLGNDCWNGDSVQFAIDMECDTKMGYFGNDFEFGLALNDNGSQLLWRWVERGKYVMKALDAEAKVVRDEAKKTTQYEMAMPLEYFSMKPEAGFKFGFTFIVNDLDAAENVEKGVGASPGIWSPKHPGLYATGQLTDKK